jgi:hypothetical protein
MSHISSIGAGMFSDLSVAMQLTPLEPSELAAITADSDLFDLFVDAVESVGAPALGADTHVRIQDVREFPAMGTPPNIVNVPVYGQATSQQIQGQADAPSLEITINYIPAEWADGTHLGDAVGNGQQYMFRFALLNSEPPTYNHVAVDGIGLPDNSQYYWIGKIEALQVNPNLTDANQATVTLSIQSDFMGAFTDTATAS